MKRKMLDMGLGLILATEGHEIRICDLDAELENELISVVEKHLEFLTFDSINKHCVVIIYYILKNPDFTKSQKYFPDPEKVFGTFKI